MSCYRIIPGICSCQSSGVAFADVKTAMKHNRIFGDLPEEELNWVEERFVVSKAPKQKILLEQGQSPVRLYLLLAGQLKWVQYMADGREVVLQLMCPGSVFGISSVILDTPYQASAWTLRASHYASMSREDLLVLIEKLPVLSMRMMEVMAEYNESLMQRIEYQSAHPPLHRLARFLLGQYESRKANHWKLPMPKAELAKLLGTTPETLSRCFHELNQQGAINIKGRDVHIMSLKKLPEFCQD